MNFTLQSEYDSFDEFYKKQKVKGLGGEVQDVQWYLSENDVRINAEGSDIIQFLSKKNVFITGGTGFLGKALIEKLLRACHDIGKIFVLIRSKKGIESSARIEEIFKDPLFFPLRKIWTNFSDKVVGINGDLTLPGFGLSAEDRALICEEVHIIFNVAATTRFDEKLKVATAINVGGTLKVLQLASECKNLVVLAHSSTAYSFCPQEEIDEVFYDTPLRPSTLMSVIKNTPDDMLEDLTPGILGDWPNVYTYTKAVAEELLRQYSKQFPICVFRPSIVTASYKEPHRGWCDTLFGPIGFLIGYLLGLLRVAMSDLSANAEIIPVDYVVNAFIASTYNTSLGSSPKIFNYVISTENKMELDTVVKIAVKQFHKVSSTNTVWSSGVFVTKSAAIYKFLAFFVHTIPAILMDSILNVSGNKIKMTKIYEKINNFNLANSYFLVRNWNHKNQNTQELWKTLNEADQKAFPFDLKTIDWNLFMTALVYGSRTFIQKESWGNLEEARKRAKTLKRMHQILKITLSFIGLGLLYGVYRLFIIFNTKI